jgi:hypothetical protein
VPSPARRALQPLLFWSRRHAQDFERWLRENWPLILHACCDGFTVMLLPSLMNWLAPLGSSTKAVTAVAVMAIPTTAVLEPDSRTVVQRAVYRLVGCGLGALLGLSFLHWVGSAFAIGCCCQWPASGSVRRFNRAAPASAMPVLRLYPIGALRIRRSSKYLTTETSLASNHLKSLTGMGIAV